MKKNIKLLIPLAILLLTAISFYSLLQTNIKSANEYKSILSSAREYASQGIVDDSAKYYRKALELKCDADTYIEYVNLYVDNGYNKKALRLAEDMVNEVDDSAAAYECLLDRYIALKSYEDCFKLDDKVTKKHLRSESFAQKMSEIEYTYDEAYQLYSDVSTFSGGYAAVKSDELYGFVDETGNNVLNKSYKKAGCFSYYTNKSNSEDSGFVAPVCTDTGEWMYISPSGSKKIDIKDDLKLQDLGLYIDKGLTAACVGGKYSYYDTNFEKQFGEYEYAGAFNCGRAAVRAGNNEWYIVNEKGEQLNTTPYLDVIIDEKGIAFRNDRAFALIDSNYYMIDVDGNVVGDQKYINARPFLDTTYAAVNIGGKWGYTDKDGKIVISPQYMDAHSFSNSFAAVNDKGKWGFINSDGTLVIDYTFEDVKDFNSKGCVFICENSRWILIKLYRYNH